MRLTSEEKEVRDSFKGICNCEICHKHRYCEPHEPYCRGAGGPVARVNIISVCRPCHIRYQSGTANREFCIRIIAAREGMADEAVVAEIWRLRQERKKAHRPKVAT